MRERTTERERERERERKSEGEGGQLGIEKVYQEKWAAKRLYLNVGEDTDPVVDRSWDKSQIRHPSLWSGFRGLDATFETRSRQDA